MSPLLDHDIVPPESMQYNQLQVVRLGKTEAYFRLQELHPLSTVSSDAATIDGRPRGTQPSPWQDLRIKSRAPSPWMN